MKAKRSAGRFLSVRARDVATLARPEVVGLVPYVGGKSLDELERQTGRRNFLKLASNENALGPSPKALAAMRSAIRAAHQYPEGSYPALKSALAAKFKLTPSNVVLGDGSNEILVLAANAFIRPGDEAVMATPSFSVFAHAVTGAGGRAVQVNLKDMRHDLPAMAKAVTRRTKLVFVCNPNNPTGTIVTRAEVERFLTSLPAGLIVVFDEAYAEFADDRRFPDSLAYVRKDLRVLVVRTFAKLYGLAGLRVGYGLGPEALVGIIERLRQPFNVNALAYRAAVAALGDRAYVTRTLAMARAGRRTLAGSLAKLGFPSVPSQANFLLVRVPGSGRAASAALERAGVIVRPLPGALAGYVRVTIGTPAQQRVVLGAFRSLRYN